MTARHYAKPAGGRPRKEDEAENIKFSRQLYALQQEGLTCAQIAERFDLCTSTVWRRIQKVRDGR